MRYTKHVEKTIRTKWLQGWAIEFLKGLSKIEGRESIESYCQQKKASYEELCKDKSRTPNGWKNTVAAYMSQIRRAIESWQNEIELDQNNSYPQKTKDGIVSQHLALLYMNYDAQFHKERSAPTVEKKQQQRRNLVDINNVPEYQERIEGLLKSRDWRELAASLIAATGRRPSEILRNGEFEQVRQFEVSFSGQVKTRGQKRQAYVTFTLIESAKVLDALARLRKLPEIKRLKTKTLAQMDSGTNSTLNRIVRESFETLLDPPCGEAQLSAKNLRASYAAIAIHLFCSWKQSPNQFISERLGHVNDVAATNYEDYQVCDKNGVPQTRGVWFERIGERVELPKAETIQHYRLRIAAEDRAVLDDESFLPGENLADRMAELVRLARLGKALESGEIGVGVRASHSPEGEPEALESQPAQTDGASPLSEMPSEELFSSHRPGSAREKIRRVVAAIKSYNSSQYEQSTQWAINSGVIKALTNINSKAIKEYLNSDEGRLQVSDYNAMNGFSFHHNRGREKPITEFVRIA